MKLSLFTGVEIRTYFIYQSDYLENRTDFAEGSCFNNKNQIYKLDYVKCIKKKTSVRWVAYIVCRRNQCTNTVMKKNAFRIKRVINEKKKEKIHEENNIRLFQLFESIFNVCICMYKCNRITFKDID